MMAHMIRRTFAAVIGVLLAIGCSDSLAQEATASTNSISPDKQWEYRCQPYGSLGQCAPVILKAGTNDVVIDLDTELGVNGPEVSATEVLWAPDSKRFACNFSPAHAHHTTYVVVAFYQLQGDKWVKLQPPADEASPRVQLAQLGKGHLPKDFNPRHCSTNYDVLKVRSWPDPTRAIIYAPCYDRTKEEKVAFLFTLKFDDAGKWKVVETHRISKKELETAEQ